MAVAHQPGVDPRLDQVLAGGEEGLGEAPRCRELARRYLPGAVQRFEVLRDGARDRRAAAGGHALRGTMEVRQQRADSGHLPAVRCPVGHPGGQRVALVEADHLHGPLDRRRIARLGERPSVAVAGQAAHAEVDVGRQPPVQADLVLAQLTPAPGIPVVEEREGDGLLHLEGAVGGQEDPRDVGLHEVRMRQRGRLGWAVGPLARGVQAPVSRPGTGVSAVTPRRRLGATNEDGGAPPHRRCGEPPMAQPQSGIRFRWMAATTLATELVRSLRPALARRRPLRRRQGRQPRRADRRRPAGARRLRGRRADLRGVLRRDGPARAPRSSCSTASTWTTRAALERRGRGPGDGARPSPCRSRSATARSAAPTRRSRGGEDDVARRGALVGDRRGHRVGLVRGHERDLPEHPAAPTRSSTRCAAAGPRCSARARSSTAPSAASARPTWTSPWSSSARSQSTRAGVMFTIDPASGRDGPARDRGLVRARRGGRLGLGLARPLRGRQGGARASSSREVRRKELVIESVAGGSGTVTREARADEATAPVLSDDEVRELAELGRADRGALRRRRRTPSGRSTPTATCYMLQSRPVTVDRRAASPQARPAPRRRAARPRPRRGARRRSGPRARARDAGRRRRAWPTATCS